MEEVWGSQQTQ